TIRTSETGPEPGRVGRDERARRAPYGPLPELAATRRPAGRGIPLWRDACVPHWNGICAGLAVAQSRWPGHAADRSVGKDWGQARWGPSLPCPVPTSPLRARAAAL